MSILASYPWAKMTSQSWENPYFDAVAGGVTVGQNRSSWSDKAMDVFRDRESLIETYGFAIPNEPAINTILDNDPVLEVFAGCGYWAWLIHQAGGDILAVDLEAPVGEEWHSVWAGDARDVVLDYPTRSLLMVWPPFGNPVATEVLGRYASAGGECVIYVGEGRGGCTADDRFHRMLHEEWMLEETVPIPTYLGVHDRLEVWKRND